MASPYSQGCILLEIIRNENRGYYEDWWLIIGFFIGLIIGLILGYICLRCCINSYFKKQRQDEEQQVRLSKLREGEQDKEFRQKFGLEKKSIRKSLKKRLNTNKKKKRKGGKRSEGEEESTYTGPTVLTALEADDLEAVQAGDGVDGMVDAVVQTTEEAGENELLKKDLVSTATNEQNIRQNRIIALAELCRLYLNKLVQAGRLDEASYDGLIEFIHSTASGLQSKADADLKVAEEEIRADPQLQKDPAAMNKKLEELPSKQNSILNALLLEEQSNLTKRLAKTANLTEQEADALMTSLAIDLSKWESALSDQQKRQAAKLEERLARRRQLVAVSQGAQSAARDEVEAQLEAKEQQLRWLGEQAPNQTNEKQRQEILATYRSDLLRLHAANEESVQKQQEALQERLRQHREQRLRDLSQKQMLKKQDFLRRVDQVTDTDDFIKAFGALMEQQTDEREALVTELDHQEVQALLDVRRDLDAAQQTHVNELEDKFYHRMRSDVGLDPNDVENLVSLHEHAANEFRRMKKMERRMQDSKLAERLAQRRQEFENEQQRADVEEKTLRDQQTTTLRKAMNLQMELPDEAKDRILKDHEQNVSTFTNQLALSRQRQLKQTEQRMAERRAKVAALRQQKEDERLRRRGERSKDLERLEADYDAKIAAAETEAAAARAQELNAMRDRLAAETAEALAAQEAQMSAVIARMQLGQARRQQLIAKQDKMIEELEAKLETRLSAPGTLEDGDPAARGLEQLLQTHYNQASSLGEQLREDRERQEAALAEKLRRKRMKKEQALETKIDAESGQEMERLQRAGMTRAGQVIMEAAMDSKHQAALNDLEKEMMVEFQREKEEMNRQLEAELEQTLAEQQKAFLAQLASVARLDEGEVNQVAEAAARDAGATGRDLRRFSRDFRDSFRKRNSSAYGDDLDYGDEETQPRPTVASDYPAEDGRPSRKSKRSKKHSKKSRDDAQRELSEDF